MHQNRTINIWSYVWNQFEIESNEAHEKRGRERREREQQIDPRITNEIIMLEIGTESDQQKMGKR